MSLLIPGKVAADLEAERFIEERLEVARYWDRELQRLDPRLSLVWVNENATSPGLVPGRWHIRRENEQTADSFIPVVGPEDEYRDMGSDVLERLKAADRWNDAVERERKRRAERAKRRAAHDRELRAEQRRDVMAETIRVASRVAGEGGMRKRRWGAG